jgi:hemerythrin superfamily protein
MARTVPASKKTSAVKSPGELAVDRSSPAQAREPDAVSLLKLDHRIVEELFAEFQRAEGLQVQPLAERICKLLRVHTQIEEELLYPVARRTIAEKDLVDDALAEHNAAKTLIARIEKMSADDRSYRATVEELSAAIKEHVEEEEGELFPQMRQARLDLQQIGIALAERRATLLDVLGLHDDDLRPALPQSDSIRNDSSSKTEQPH